MTDLKNFQLKEEGEKVLDSLSYFFCFQPQCEASMTNKKGEKDYTDNNIVGEIHRCTQGG